MALTPLHRALGLPPSPLDFSMLTRAINQGIGESDDLDWKRELPNPHNPNASVEFAKDVAALVNNGGGMIVYGVAEASSVAASIHSVKDWDESSEQRLRSWAYSMVQPPVHGLVFTELTGPSQDGENGDRAVVLEIPPSLDTPHFVFHKSTIRAPRRYGSHTVDMSERDIEQAYRRRFEDRRNNDRGLAGLLEQVLIGVDKGGAPWLVAAARPTRPRPAHTDRISRAEAQTILNELRSHNPFLEGGEGLPGVDINPRPGYRKWRSTDTRSWFDGTVVDIHDDGSVALGLKATQGQDGFAKDTDIHEMQAHTVPAHIIHLVRMVATRMSMAGTFEISISITSPSGGPVYIRTLEMTGSHGFLRDRDELTPILAFQSVTGLVDVHDPDPEVLTTVRNLALDILNQAGSSALSPRYLKKSS